MTFYEGNTHTDTSDITHTFDCFFNIILDDTLTRKKALVLYTELKSHQSSVNRRSNLGCAGGFCSIADDATYISEYIDNSQRYLLISTSIHVCDTGAGTTCSADCTTVCGKTSYIIFLMNGNQIADDERTTELFM